MPSAGTQLDPEIVIIIKSEREIQTPCDIIFMLNLKYDTNELIYIIEIDLRDIENRLVVAMGGGRDGVGVWD